MAYFTIIRPLNGIMAAIAVYIGSLIAGSSFVPSIPVMLGMLVVFLISSGGMVINDIVDAAADAINRPKRPISSGAMSKKMAGFYSAVLFFIGIVIAYKITEQAFYVALLATVLLIWYSAKLKSVAVVGNLIVSALVGITFIYGGIIVGNYAALIPLSLLAFLSNMGREIYKTIDDALGDKSTNVRTVAIIFGVPRARMIGSVFIIAAVILSFVPYFLQLLNETYLFVVLIADIVFLAAALGPLKYSSKFAKVAMFIALVAFFVGAVSIPDMVAGINTIRLIN